MTYNAPDSAARPANDADLLDLVAQPPSVTLDGEVRATEDFEPGATNLNPLANAMADAQGVRAGSWAWMLAGPAPFAGQSGEQASYGWRHTHKLTPSYIRAVLANYGHRRSYYSHAPYRQFGYEAAGRPHVWQPESGGDMPDGSTVYMTSGGDTRVTGPDAEHFWLTPLFAVADDPDPIMVETGLGNKLPSNMVAKWLATMLVSSAVGMVRDHRTMDGNPYPWTYGDRATGRLLHTIVEGFKRGCLRRFELPTAARYLADVVLPFYENGPGIHTFGEPREGRFPMGLFNGLHWIVPACYDAAQVLRKSGATGWADRFDALVARWSSWMHDMHETLPHECFRADRLFVAPEFGLLEQPPESIKSMIRAEDFLHSFDFAPWAYRAVAIAAKVNGSPGLREARDRIASEYRGEASKKQWLVDAGGQYEAGE